MHELVGSSCSCFHSATKRSIYVYIYVQHTDFNLSGVALVLTLSKIARNGQIWEFTGSHMDHSSPNYVALFLFPKTQEKLQYGPKKHKHVDFREKKSLRSYMPNTKVGKKILQYNPLKIDQFNYL